MFQLSSGSEQIVSCTLRGVCHVSASGSTQEFGFPVLGGFTYVRRGIRIPIMSMTIIGTDKRSNIIRIKNQF